MNAAGAVLELQAGGPFRGPVGDLRLVRVEIAREFVAEWLQTGFRPPGRPSIVRGLPFGAHLVGAQLTRDCLELLFEHESFAPVPFGAPVPDVAVLIETIAAEAAKGEA